MALTLTDGRIMTACVVRDETVTPERWQQIKTIVADALELEVDRREAFLASACGSDAALRDEVDSLLETADDDFLDDPAVGRPPQVPDSAFASAASDHGSVEEVRPIDMPPYTRLVVSTRGSRYEVTIVAPLALECVIVGGRHFERPVRAHLHQQEVIEVGEPLRLRIGTRKIVTTPIEHIEIL